VAARCKKVLALSHQTGVQRMVSIRGVVCDSLQMCHPHHTVPSYDIPLLKRQKVCGLANSSKLALYVPVARGTNGGTLPIKLKKKNSVFMLMNVGVCSFCRVADV